MFAISYRKLFNPASATVRLKVGSCILGEHAAMTTRFSFFSLDGFADFFLSRVCAGVTVFFNENNVWNSFGVFSDCVNVYGSCNVCTAVADENANS